MSRYNPLKPNKPARAPRAKPIAAGTVPDPVPVSHEPVLTENDAKDGLELRFPTRPTAEVLALFHATQELPAEQRWHWHRRMKLWYARRNDTTRAFAAKILGNVVGTHSTASQTSPSPVPPADLVEAIVKKVGDAERNRVTVVEGFGWYGTDGKVYTLGCPEGVKATGEKTPPYYVFQMRDGTTVGQRHNTRQEAETALEESALRAENSMREAMAKATPAEVQAQADYWLKPADAAPVEKKALNEPGTNVIAVNFAPPSPASPVFIPPPRPPLPAWRQRLLRRSSPAAS